MNPIRLALAAAASLLAVAAVAPVAGAHLRTASAQTVTVTMTEFKFAFVPRAVHPGVVTFRLVNKGSYAGGKLGIIARIKYQARGGFLDDRFGFTSYSNDNGFTARHVLNHFAGNGAAKHRFIF